MAVLVTAGTCFEVQPLLLAKLWRAKVNTADKLTPSCLQGSSLGIAVDFNGYRGGIKH